ncbi:MAG: UbiA prenyltransferase family protein [Candidatus Bathyarchaeota archaeon]|nr:MAG: UbiA prenyltransferase family protein [Candidatus Bathyarchaeota archaeon]
MARRLYTEKLIGFIKLTRPYILLTSTPFFLGSTFLSVHGIPPIKNFIAGFLSVSFAIAASHTINDFFDWKTDSRNPRTIKRPIPTGLISPNEALVFAIVLGICALGIAFFLNSYSAIIAIASIPLPFLYNFLRKHGIPFSFVCPVFAEQNIILIGSTSITGRLMVNNIWPLLILSLFWETGRTLNSGIQDVSSDKASRIVTLPVILKPKIAAWLVLSLFSFASITSVLIGIIAKLGILYRVISLASGLWLIYEGTKLVKEPTTQQAVKTRTNAPKFVTIIFLTIAISYVINKFTGF